MFRIWSRAIFLCLSCLLRWCCKMWYLTEVIATDHIHSAKLLWYLSSVIHNYYLAIRVLEGTVWTTLSFFDLVDSFFGRKYSVFGKAMRDWETMNWQNWPRSTGSEHSLGPIVLKHANLIGSADALKTWMGKAKDHWNCDHLLMSRFWGI